MVTTCGVDNSFTFGSDPNNSTTITAVAGYGAIQVSWNYPSINPHAVAHVILRRGTSSSGSGSQLAVVKGSTYRDPMGQAQAGTTYYYWIQLVSVNGTTLALVGPASATARSLSGDTLALLSNQINTSHLADLLRSEIETIPSLRDDLIDETTGRLQALSDVDDVLASLGLDVTQTFAAIVSESSSRIDGDNVNASLISAVAVSNGENLAAIVTEQNARVTAVSAEATQRETLAVRVGTAENAITSAESAITAAEAAIVTEQTVRANADGSLANQINSVVSLSINTFRQASAPTMTNGANIGSLWFDTDDNNKPYRWSGSAWQNAQDGDVVDAFAAIQAEQTARTSAGYAFASDVTTVESSVTVLSNTVTSLDGTVTTLDGTVTNLDGTVTTLDGSVTTLGNNVNSLDTDVSNLGDDVGDLAADLALVPNIISASIQTNNSTAVGYCMIGGVPSTATNRDTKSECEAAGGTWLALRQIATAVKGVQISDNDGTGKIEQKMQSYRNDIGHLEQSYTVKFQQSGSNTLIGGFGLAVNNNTATPTLDCHFDVDKFSVGKLGSEFIPFAVVDNTVYIQNAMINDASINTLRIAGEAVSVTVESSASYVNMVIFDTNSSSAALRYTTGGGDLSDVANVIANSNSNSGQYSHLITLTPGEQGSAAKFVVSVSCSVGIKARQSSKNINILFYPRLFIYRNGAFAFNPRLPPVVITPDACSSTPYEFPYAVTQAFTVADGGYYQAKLAFYTTDFQMFSGFGSGTVSIYDNDWLHYAYIRSSKLVTHVLKR